MSTSWLFEWLMLHSLCAMYSSQDSSPGKSRCFRSPPHTKSFFPRLQFNALQNGPLHGQALVKKAEPTRDNTAERRFSGRGISLSVSQGRKSDKRTYWEKICFCTAAECAWWWLQANSRMYLRVSIFPSIECDINKWHKLVSVVFCYPVQEGEANKALFNEKYKLKHVENVANQASSVMLKFYTLHALLALHTLITHAADYKCRLHLQRARSWAGACLPCMPSPAIDN